MDNKTINEHDFIESQQLDARRGPQNSPPGSQSLSAPPNFTPEMPGGDQRGFSGGSSHGGRNQGSGIRSCLNSFTYIWLINGRNFWFYPTFIGRHFVEGFRWRNDRWVFDRINMNMVLFFQCSNR